MSEKNEIKEEDLNKVSGGNHIEPVDGLYCFRKGQLFIEYLNSSHRLKCHYDIYEDKDATINDSILCRVRVIYDGDPLESQEKYVSVAKLVEFEKH